MQTFVTIPWGSLPKLSRVKGRALAAGDNDAAAEIDALMIAGQASHGPVIIGSRLFSKILVWAEIEIEPDDPA